MLKIQEGQFGNIFVVMGDDHRAVATFRSKEDAELFVRAKGIKGIAVDLASGKDFTACYIEIDNEAKFLEIAHKSEKDPVAEFFKKPEAEK